MAQFFIDLAQANGGISISPADISANTNGAVIDLQNSDMRTNLLVSTGVVQANANFSAFVTECDTSNGTFTNVADTNATTGTILNSAGNTNATFIKSFLRTKRYVKVRANIAGTNADTFIGAWILAQKKFEPGGSGANMSPSV